MATVVDDPVQARSGRRALCLTGATPLRLGQVTFLGSSPQTVAEVTSEGAYTFVSRELPAPPSATVLRLMLRLEGNTSGTACFDDLLVEPMTSVP